MTSASEPIFWEMYTRGETERLCNRFLDLLLLAGSTAAFFAAGIATVNPPFVELWTKGRVHWSSLTDAVLMLWIVAQATATILNMVPGITKKLGSMRFVYLGEGLVLAGIGYLPWASGLPLWQVVLILLVCAGLFRLPYGWARARSDSGLEGRQISTAFGRITLTTLILLGIGLGLRALLSTLPLILQILIGGGVYTLIALAIIYRISLPDEARHRVAGMSRRLLSRLSGRAAQ
jgi:hypothetical protein